MNFLQANGWVRVVQALGMGHRRARGKGCCGGIDRRLMREERTRI